MNISGRKAVVLGGTSGIGLATVQALEHAGAHVVAVSRSEKNRLEAAKTVGDGVSFRGADVLDRKALEALFLDEAPFDILVSAATGGARAAGPFLEMDLDAFQASFRKLWGYTNSVRLAARHMAEDGAIVLVSGYPARKPSLGAAAISTVGNAVEGFARAIAVELAPRRINVVSPGIIDTPMHTTPAEVRNQLLEAATKRMPISRLGQADEIARAILFLIESDFTTGATLDVDGGARLA
ncbi:SDR family oxidoreductase [Myxococcota bacterium]|nr:SDR family oxidoreductase [Myxococcota bacterium]